MKLEPCPDCGCEDRETDESGRVICAECGWALNDENYEPPEPDGEDFRGGEAAAYEAEYQAWIQRNLK